MRATCCAAMLVGACTFDPAPGTAPGPDDAPLEALCADGDGDGDGVCNGVDDWPCGTMPADPGEVMNDSLGDRRWHARDIAIGDRRRIVVPAGAAFRTDFGWTVTVNCGAPGMCMAFLEYGFGGTRAGCVRGGVVPSGQARGDVADPFLAIAPATSGLYELRLNAARIDVCGTSDLWFGGDPGPESTIAYVCVP